MKPTYSEHEVHAMVLKAYQAGKNVSFQWFKAHLYIFYKLKSISCNLTYQEWQDKIKEWNIELSDEIAEASKMLEQAKSLGDIRTIEYLEKFIAARKQS
jgi:hypothetical protein